MSAQTQARAGLVGLVTGVLGAVGALVLLLWPPQVAPSRVSYPFTATGFRTIQLVFFVHHFGLLAAFVALAACGAVGARRIYRAGAWLAVLGMVLLTGAELLATRYADWDFDAANSGLMGAAYGVASVIIGLGMLVAGVGVAHTRSWTGWHRWTPLAIGIGQYLVILGISGGFVLARISIGLWMLLIATLGWSLFAESRRDLASSYTRDATEASASR